MLDVKAILGEDWRRGGGVARGRGARLLRAGRRVNGGQGRPPPLLFHPAAVASPRPSHLSSQQFRTTRI